ncbi:DUF5753 domain-containing protein [Actinokineospora enzanensis]|uniref:DUF5753 domain-containing protein n=1 Tax=Actinokineospora enzanensis TaxID=155975 RepID=UPI000362A072|nr:DUF5753 domain-containing protein [Actinokineospora enzanensis]
MVEEDPDPVVQRLICGEKAREWRLKRGVELVDADAALGKYRGKLSKIETGMLAPKPDEVNILVELYQLGGAAEDDFRRLASAARKRTTAPSNRGEELRYISLERSASEIRMIYPEVPGLLQTEEYGLAGLAKSTYFSAADFPRLARARVERSSRLLAPSGPRVFAVLGEAALHYEVGGRDVLLRQLEWLREIADLETVAIRVFPFTAGGNPALTCPFTLLHIPAPTRTIAYVETLTGADYVKATQPYGSAFTLAWEEAESEEDTRVRLERRIADLS